MSRRSGLGKGLGALIPTEGAVQSGAGLEEIPISKIRANVNQPRSSFDEDSLSALTESVREMGVLQPVLLRPLEDGEYELIAGERRWRASRRAGLHTIPAVVRGVDDLVSLEQAVVENLHRQDLNPLEEAAAYQQLIEDFGLTQDQAARRVGKSRSAVANLLRLFQLPPTVQKLVGDGELSAGHAKVLLSTPDRSLQESLARKVVGERLSVRATETLLAESLDDSEAPPPDKSSKEPTGSSSAKKLRPPGLLELERLLSERLDTSVQVTMTSKKGRVAIDFANLEDLERIYRLISSDG